MGGNHVLLPRIADQVHPPPSRPTQLHATPATWMDSERRNRVSKLQLCIMHGYADQTCGHFSGWTTDPRMGRVGDCASDRGVFAPPTGIMSPHSQPPHSSNSRRSQFPGRLEVLDDGHSHTGSGQRWHGDRALRRVVAESAGRQQTAAPHQPRLRITSSAVRSVLRTSKRWLAGQARLFPVM